MNSPLPIILLIASGIFGWQGFRGIAHGSTNFPMMLIAMEELERGHTMFWGVVGLNIIACCGLITLSFFAFVKGW